MYYKVFPVKYKWSFTGNDRPIFVFICCKWPGFKGETIHRMYWNHDYFGDSSGSRYVEAAYDMMLIFWKKSSVELPFSSFGDHLINILRKVNRLIYAFKIN